jgi:HAD superfamily hydrolase (TIGR01662 family)
MLRDIENAGGRIDKIYVCTALAESHSLDRKPETGMALQAKRDFPEVDFHKSVMVGDSLSDMQFGYRCGMRCVYLTNGKDVPVEIRDYTDITLPNLPCM